MTPSAGHLSFSLLVARERLYSRRRVCLPRRSTCVHGTGHDEIMKLRES